MKEILGFFGFVLIGPSLAALILTVAKGGSAWLDGLFAMLFLGGLYVWISSMIERAKEELREEMEHSNS